MISLEPDFARVLDGYLWIADDVRSLEPHVAAAWAGLAKISVHDPALAEVVMAFDWVQDGIVNWEGRDITTLADSVEADQDLAALLTSYPWVEDRISHTERASIKDLNYTARYNAALAREVAAYSWVQDGIDNIRESGALFNFYILAQHQEEERDILMRQPWFTDGHDEDDITILHALDAGYYTREAFAKLAEAPSVRTFALTMSLAGPVEFNIVSAQSYAHQDEIFGLIQDAAQFYEIFLGMEFPGKTVAILVYQSEGRGGLYGHYDVVELNHNGRPTDDPRFLRTLFHEIAHIL